MITIINLVYFSVDDEILMKDLNGDIILFNVKSLNTTVLAKNTTQVSFYYSNANILQFTYK